MKSNKLTWVRKFLTIGLALSIIVPLMAACGNGDTGNKSANQRVLRIGTLWGSDDDTFFRQQYTQVFEFQNPNIKVEIVPAVDSSRYRYGDKNEQEPQIEVYEEAKKLLTGSNPVDMLLVDPLTFKRLYQDNLIKQLDPMIQQDKFNTEDIVSSVIDGIREIGEGNIYGLTPTFRPAALFYNKKIFNDAGVDLPTENMSWDDIFALARRVNKVDPNNRIFGFQANQWSAGDPYQDLMTYVAPLQLRMYDDTGSHMTVDTPSWEKAWETIVQLTKEKVLPTQADYEALMQKNTEEYNPIAHDNFLNGRTAMVLADYSYVNEIENANKNADRIKNFKKIEWDIVSYPTHPEAPGISSSVSYGDIAVINAKAKNDKDAWELIKMMNSEDMAKIKSNSSWEVVTRKKYIQPKEGVNFNIAAFFNTKPVPPTFFEVEQKYPYIWQVQEVGRKLFLDVVEGKKSVKDALVEWQKKGDALLIEIKKDPKKPPAISEEGAVSGVNQAN